MWLKMKTSADISCNADPISMIRSFGTRFIFIGVLALVISACASTKHTSRQGTEAESSALGTSHAERLSEYEEFRGEKKSCIASWYGREFHGKPTASGEEFNMFALTCAHRDYPLGTRVRVTNPSNNREVECIINDRGPFVSGRDIDLSYAAAKKIGLIGPGIARVDVEPIGRYTRYIKDVRYSHLEGGLVTIQIGSFRDESNAKRLKRGLELHYKDIYITQANIGSDKYYRVRIGKFKNSGDALKLADTLAQEGYSVLITKYEQQI
jgi:rare lipoprotein A